jgi:hypothetical protein
MRRYADFIGATKNEIAVDEMLFCMAGTNAENMGYLPRPPKWIGYGRRFPVITYSLSLLARYFWVLGGSSIFFIIQFILACVSLGRYKAEKIGNIDHSGFVLALSSRVGDIVNSKIIPDLPSVWITMPWVALSHVPENSRCINIFSLLSRKELWTACRNAMVATSLLRNRKRTFFWILQSYTAFRWFAVRIVLEKLSGRFIMAEHFDRWAILVDSVVLAHNSKNKNNKKELILVQHGAVDNIDEGGRSSDLRLFRKLRCVNELYVYGTAAENAFKARLLSPGCVRREVKVSYYKPEIDLKMHQEGEGLKVLFVGHSLCEELHAYIFTCLARELEFFAYYKPHPLAPMSEGIGTIGWMVIDEKRYFPVVDLLISYPSTLVDEYSGAGVPAMVHPMNLLKKDADDFVRSVGLKLKSLRDSKIN